MNSYSIKYLEAPDAVMWAGRGQNLRQTKRRNEGLEIVFLERGQVTWTVDDRPVELPGGSLFYIFPWEMHGSVNEYEPGHYWHFVALRGDSPDLRARPMSFRRLGLKKSDDEEMMCTLEGASQRCWPATERVAMTIKELVQEAMDPKARHEEIRSTLSKFLLLELARIISEGPAATSPEVQCPPKVKKLLRELQAHPEKKWTLPEMAKSCGQHQTYFIKAVRQLTGDTPMLYLRRVRIDRARGLLQTKTPITEIAFQCGFESSQHFARIFREFTGQSASEYRKNPRS